MPEASPLRHLSQNGPDPRSEDRLENQNDDRASTRRHPHRTIPMASPSGSPLERHAVELCEPRRVCALEDFTGRGESARCSAKQQEGLSCRRAAAATRSREWAPRRTSQILARKRPPCEGTPRLKPPGLWPVGRLRLVQFLCSFRLRPGVGHSRLRFWVRCRGLEGRLIGDLEGLRSAAKLGQAGGDDGRVLPGSQHSDCGFARGQLAGDALLVGLGQPQPLVMECPCCRAAEDADPDGRRPQEKQGSPDTSTLAGAPGADLVLLELPFGVEDEDPGAPQ